MIDPILSDVLTRVQEIPDAGKAFIAGGAVRDSLYGRAFKDIDIFLPVNSQEHFEDLYYQLLDHLGGRQLPTSAQNQYTKSGFYQRPMSLIGLLEVDFVGVTDPNTPTEVLNTFDFGLNRVWFDGKQVHKTPEFEDDFNNNTCSLLSIKNMADLPKLMQKANRFQLNFGSAFKAPSLKIVSQKKPTKVTAENPLDTITPLTLTHER